MENWFEERKKRQKENRRNLVFTGNYRAIINSIIEFYEDKENIDRYEICLNGSAIVDNEHLYRLCKNIKDTMIHKCDYENVKINNAELSKKCTALEKSNSNLLNEIRNFDNEIRKNEIIQNFEKNRFELSNKLSEYSIKNSNLQQKVNELEKSIEKWKAMYTGQCEANKKLIDMLGDK